MELDDTLCYCFHVPLRKVVSYFRVERPKRASQISSFCGAGGGCGWCVPLIMEVHRAAQAGRTVTALEMTPDEAKLKRLIYHRETGARPPPATGGA